MNRNNHKKIIIVVVLMIFIASMASYFGPRYGWRIFGFRYCTDPSTIFLENLKIDYDNDFIEITGNTSASMLAYVGTIHKLNETTLYVGLKYNSLLSFSRRDGRFDVHILIETQSIEKIILKGNQTEKTIYEKGGPAPEPDE